MPASDRLDVAGLCNALVDTLVLVDDSSLEALPWARGIMHPVDHATWEAAYERFLGPEMQVHAGGSGANTLSGLGFLGARARFRGQTGDDDLGRRYAASLIEACGSHALRVAPGLHTGKCLALVSRRDGERTMLVDLGAAPQLPDLGSFEDDIRQARVFHFTGYTLLPSAIRDTALAAVQVARASGVAVSLDVSDPFVVKALREDLWRLLRTSVDVAFLNEEEASALCDGLPAEDAVHEIARHVPVTVVKLGGRGSLVEQDGVLTPVGVHRVAAVDTTGAGDAYAAGFLYGFTRGWAPGRSGRLGARVAGLTVAQVGAVVRDRARLAAAIEAVKELP